MVRMELFTQQYARHVTDNRISLRIDSFTMRYIIIYVLGTFQTFYQAALYNLSIY